MTLVAVIIVIAVALGFDYVNGFHDAANSIATVVSTRVLSPRTAVAWAAFFNFAAFLVIGVFLFRFSSSAITSGAGSIIRNRSLITSLRFPRLLLPVAAVLAELLTLLPALLVLVGVVLLTGEPVTWHWLLLPAAVLLQWLFGTGLSLVVARLVAERPDDEDPNIALALEIDRAMRERAPAGWRGDGPREAQVLNALFPLMGRNREATRALFELLKNQAGYQ